MSINYAYIGVFNFITLEGDLVSPGQLIETVQRPGIDGTIWRLLGSKGEPFEVKTVAFTDTADNCRTLIIAYKMAQGTDLVMVDMTGESWGIVVEQVTPKQPKYIGSSTLGSGYLIEAVWRLRMPGAS